MHLALRRYRSACQGSGGRSSERRGGGVKAHVLYDLEAQVPAFHHIATASVYDSKAMTKTTQLRGTLPHTADEILLRCQSQVQLTV